jgi:hypothetical protein
VAGSGWIWTSLSKCLRRPDEEAGQQGATAVSYRSRHEPRSGQGGVVGRRVGMGATMASMCGCSSGGRRVHRRKWVELGGWAVPVSKGGTGGSNVLGRACLDPESRRWHNMSQGGGSDGEAS